MQLDRPLQTGHLGYPKMTDRREPDSGSPRNDLSTAILDRHGMAIPWRILPETVVAVTAAREWEFNALNNAQKKIAGRCSQLDLARRARSPNATCVLRSAAVAASL